MGMDDLRMFYFYLKRPMPIYCEAQVESRLRRSFDYAFVPDAKNFAGGVPVVDFHEIEFEPFEVLGAKITPFRLLHGRFKVLGFRIGNVAYCTDTNSIPPESMALARRTRCADHRRTENSAARFALQLGRSNRGGQHAETEANHLHAHGSRSGPRRNHSDSTQGMELAYDGLRVQLT